MLYLGIGIGLLIPTAFIVGYWMGQRTSQVIPAPTKSAAARRPRFWATQELRKPKVQDDLKAWRAEQEQG